MRPHRLPWRLVGLMVAGTVPRVSAQHVATVTEIRLERTTCLGACPAYTVSVTAGGDVHFIYGGRTLSMTHDSLRAGAVRDAHIDPRQAAELLVRIESLGFFSIAEDWTGRSPANCPTAPTDAPSAIVTVIEPNRSHRVTHYDGCPTAPRALIEIENAIDSTTGVRRWLGGPP